MRDYEFDEGIARYLPTHMQIDDLCAVSHQ